MNVNDIVGQTIHHVTVIAYTGKRDGKYHSYLCRCVCGKEIPRLRQSLTGKTVRKSCGCVRPSMGGAKNGMFKHGKARASRAYHTWSTMRGRCSNPTNPKYPDYGGRGITVCDRWQTFANFIADMGEPPPGMSLDRIDVNGPYSPGNCRWATQRTQQNNRRNTRLFEYGGELVPLAELARRHGISPKILRQRIDRDGNGISEALRP